MPRRTRHAEYFQEGAIAVGARIMREICGAGPEEVLLSRRSPADPRPWRDFFGCPVTFNASQSVLVHSAALLDLPALDSDPRQRALLEEKVLNYWAIDLPGVSDQVVRLLRLRVVSSDARLEAVSAALGMHPRLLGRALQAEGTNFRELLKQTQADVAQRLLRGTDLSITEIGAALGYGDTSAFSNAFRRQTGQSPRGWRNAAESDLVEP